MRQSPQPSVPLKSMPSESRVLRKAVLGYLILWAILLTALGVTALCLVGFFYVKARYAMAKIAIVCAGLAFYLIKSLFARLPKPTGLAIHRADAPLLFSEIDRICEELKAPKVHHVLLTEEVSAYVVQHPLWGPFGFYRNYLVLGYPLLVLFPKDEFISVVAHELGHLSELHGKSAAWIYRTVATWSRLQNEPELKSSLLLDTLGKAFVTNLIADSMPVRRQHELEADQAMVRIAGTRAAMSALIRVSTIELALNRYYWPTIYDQASESPTPEGLEPFRSLITFPLYQSVPAPLSANWIQAALETGTHPLDTHPSLKDRLEAMSKENIAFQWSAPQGERALSLLSEEMQNRAVSQLDKEWLQQMGARWSEEHEKCRADWARIEELQAQSGKEGVSVAEWEELLTLVGRHRTPHEYLEAVKRLPDQTDLKALAEFHEVQARTKAADQAVIPKIMERIRENPHEAPAIAGIAEALFVSSGRAEDWKVLLRTAWDYDTKLRQAAAERQSVDVNSELVGIELTEEGKAFFLKSFEEASWIRRAWILEKKLIHFPESSPVTLIAVEPTLKFRILQGWGFTTTDAVAEAGLKKLTAQFGGFPGYFFYVMRGKNDLLSKKIRGCAQFYHRGS